jgi:hypothetical protein
MDDVASISVRRLSRCRCRLGTNGRLQLRRSMEPSRSRSILLRPEHQTDLGVGLAGDIEQRTSCARFALRLPPRQRCSPQVHPPIVPEPKVCCRHNLVINDRRTLTRCRPATAHRHGTACLHSAMSHRHTHPVTARPRTSVRRHLATCHHHTLMDRHRATAHMNTVRRHAQASHRRTRTDRHPDMAHNPSTIRRLSTVHLRAVMSNSRTQFRAWSRTRTPSVRFSCETARARCDSRAHRH